MKYFLMLDNHTLKETLQRILIVSANLIKSLKKERTYRLTEPFFGQELDRLLN